MVCALVVLAGGGTALALKGSDVLAGALTIPDYSGTGQGSVVVQVVSGQSSQDIALTLKKRGVVKSEKAFTHAAKQDARSRMIQPGYYRLHSHMAGRKALALLLNPESQVHEKVTVPEGLRLGQTLDLLADKTGLPRTKLQHAVDKPAGLGLPRYAHGQAEGFLFPATYEVTPGTTVQSLLRKMVDRYKVAEESTDLAAGAKRLHKSPRQVLVVASLIEREARLDADYPKVSRVIYNRLAKGMKLQLDSTVHYAVGKSGRVSTSAKDRANPSPYNTYQHAGLPPGPIDAPGEQALEAALHPARGPWLFFVTVNPDTGKTKYAVTAAQHRKNENAFHRWCRANADRC